MPTANNAAPAWHTMPTTKNISNTCLPGAAIYHGHIPRPLSRISLHRSFVGAQVAFLLTLSSHSWFCSRIHMAPSPIRTSTSPMAVWSFAYLLLVKWSAFRSLESIWSYAYGSFASPSILVNFYCMHTRYRTELHRMYQVWVWPGDHFPKRWEPSEPPNRRTFFLLWQSIITHYFWRIKLGQLSLFGILYPSFSELIILPLYSSTTSHTSPQINPTCQTSTTMIRLVMAILSWTPKFERFRERESVNLEC